MDKELLIAYRDVWQDIYDDNCWLGQAIEHDDTVSIKLMQNRLDESYKYAAWIDQQMTKRGIHPLDKICIVG